MKFDWQRLFYGPWIQIAPTDWLWDETLNKALDVHGIERLDSYLARAGNITVWVSNWPYAYGSPYKPFRSNVLPSVATRKRLRSMLHKHEMAVFAERK